MERQQDAGPKARVLILSGRSLFGEGIEGLLRQEPGLEIVGRGEEPQEAVRLIKEFHPDVILVAHGEPAEGYTPELMRLVREGFRLRVVDVHLHTNTVCLYSGEQHPIGEVRDLVDTVRHICDSLERDAEVPLSPVMGEPAI